MVDWLLLAPLVLLALQLVLTALVTQTLDVRPLATAYVLAFTQMLF